MAAIGPADPKTHVLAQATSMDRAFAVIRGETCARSLLGRIDRGEAEPDELAAMFATLHERPMFDGAAKVLKQLEEHRDD